MPKRIRRLAAATIHNVAVLCVLCVAAQASKRAASSQSLMDEIRASKASMLDPQH
jgi:hypothetical protein